MPDLVLDMVLKSERQETRSWRLVCCLPDGTAWAWIRLHGGETQPEWVEAWRLEAMVNAGELTPTEDPFSPVLQAQIASGPALQHRDARWRVIRALVRPRVPPVLFKSERGALVRRQAKKWGVSERSVRRYLWQYWTGGRTRDALTPYFNRRGGPGMPRAPGEKKRGRPPQKNSPAGINVTPEMIPKIHGAIKYLDHTLKNFKGAHGELVRTEFVSHSEDLHGWMVDVVSDERPSVDQVRYYMLKEIARNPSAYVRKIAGAKRYNLRHRPLLHSSVDRELGPGSQFQTDPTVADVNLLSEVVSLQSLGRPTLYFVTDAFSTAITGFHAGFEEASWEALRLALENAFSDKVAFCARYDVEISEEDWPCHHLPQSLLADRGGEFLSHNGTEAARSLGFRLANTASYRPDFKPIVEADFRTANRTIHRLPGAVARDRQRGDPDPRRAAVLTRTAFVRIVIAIVLKHNNVTRIKGADRLPPDYPIEELGWPTPRDLWNWGIRYRSGLLRVRPLNEIRAALLPWGTATLIPGRGLRFEGLYYAPEELLLGDAPDPPLEAVELWFHRNLPRMAERDLRVQYRPSDCGGLYVPSGAPTKPWTFRPLRDGQEFAGLSFKRMREIVGQRTDKKRAGKGEEEERSLLYDNLIEAFARDAADAVTGPPILDGIREARATEPRTPAAPASHTQRTRRRPHTKRPPERLEQYVAPTNHLDVLEELLEE